MQYLLSQSNFCDIPIPNPINHRIRITQHSLDGAACFILLHTMDISGEVMGLAAELAHAVDVIMSPDTNQQSRMEAYYACEK